MMDSKVRLLPALLVCSLLGACSLFAGRHGGGEANSAESSAEEDAPKPVDTEVPDVGKCYTDTQVCDLSEPLQPGLGCFCTAEDGTKEAGSAGGS